MMPHTKAHIIPCNESLPKYLVERLAAVGGKDFSKIAIILPTQRLHHYIRLELGRRFTSCIPPQLFTIAGFARAIPTPNQHRAISATEQNIILNALLLDGDYHYLRAGMEDDLARFFNELADQNMADTAFPRIKSLLKNDLYRDDVHLARLIEQTEELERFYKSYTNFLDSHQLADASLDFQQRVCLASGKNDLRIAKRYMKIWIAGFSDATATQLLLLKKLRQEQRCDFFFHFDGEAFFADDPNYSEKPYALLAHFVKRLGFADFDTNHKNADNANSHFVRKAFGLPADEKRFQDSTVSIHRAASPFIEVKAAAALIHGLVQTGEARPEEIVVVVPDEARHSQMLRSVLAEAKIPFSDSLGLPLIRTQIGQLLRLLLDIVLRNWRVSDLISLLGNPLLQGWLELQDKNIEIWPLQEAMRKFAEKYNKSSNLYFHIHKALKQEKATDDFPNQKHLLVFFEHFEKALKNFTGNKERTMGQWAEALCCLIEDFDLEKLIFQTQNQLFAQEFTAMKAIYSRLQYISRLRDFMRGKRKLVDFYYLLQQNILASPIRMSGQPFTGVQVMGLLECRNLPGKVLIAIGNNEGSFPMNMHRELFVADPLRYELGLTTHKKLEKLQDQLFYSLIAGFPCVHLFFSMQDGDRPAVKSRYIQRIELLNALHPGAVRYVEEKGLLFTGDFLSPAYLPKAPESLQKIYTNLQIQCTERRDVRGNFKNDRKKIFADMSPSTMEHLIFCPYRYLLHKLQFSELDLPDDDMDNREAGLWLHEVCECFFKGMDSAQSQWPDLREKWHEPINEENFARALRRLQRLSRELMDKNRPRLDYLYQMHYIGWQKFLEREMGRTDISPQESKYEFRLQHANKNILHIADLEIMISGRVDRIAIGDEEIRIIDYKTRKNWPSKKQIAAGKVPQLPLYVEMLRRQKEHQGVANWSAEYFALWDGEATELQEHAPKLELSESWRNLTEHLEKRIKTLHLQGQPMEPEEDKDYCKYCDYDGICRRQEDLVDRL